MSGGVAGFLANLEPITKDELAYAYELGGAVWSGKVPQSGVGGMGINLRDDDGGLRRIELTDIPDNRAMIAIRDQFSSEKFKAIMFRLWAMMEHMKDRRMKRFIRKEGDDEMISGAVLEVAATMPLNPQGRFYPAKFFAAVAAAHGEVGPPDGRA